MGKFEDLVSYLDKAKISPGTYIMNTEESISAVSICVNCSQSNCPNDSASFHLQRIPVILLCGPTTPATVLGLP